MTTTTPNTLIFVDLASDDPAAAGKFYAEVFGWRDDDRPYGVFHRMVPGGNFPNPDGSDSEIGNLHLGIFKAANARHWGVVVGDEAVLNLDVFTPKRAEYAA